MSRLHYAIFAMLITTASEWFLLKRRCHLQTRDSSEQVPAILQETARIFVQRTKFPPDISRK